MDFKFCLSNGAYQPYNKEDDYTKNTHSQSNDTPNTIKQIPNTFQILKEPATLYKEKLNKSGYNTNLKYTARTNDIDDKKARKSNII